MIDVIQCFRTHFSKTKCRVQEGDVDLLSVAIHEIGHNLGLDHSNVKLSIMYPFIQNDVKTLHDDDVEGIQNLYGSPIPNKPGILCYTIYPSLLYLLIVSH